MIVVPVGMPAPVADKFFDAVTKVLATLEIAERIVSDGANIVANKSPIDAKLFS